MNVLDKYEVTVSSSLDEDIYVAEVIRLTDRKQLFDLKIDHAMSIQIAFYEVHEFTQINEMQVVISLASAKLSDYMKNWLNAEASLE